MSSRGFPSHRALFALFAAVLQCYSTAAFADIHSGDLLIADTQGSDFHGIIIDLNPVTHVQTVVASGGYLGQPDGICWDPSNNTLIVADAGGFTETGGVILRINPYTGQQTIVSVGGSLAHPTAVAFDSSGDLIVSQEGGKGGPIAVLRINPTTGSQTVVSSAMDLGVATGVAVESSGSYLVSNYAGGTFGSGIVRVDQNTGAQSVVAFRGDLNYGPQKIWLDNTKSQSFLVTAGNSSTQSFAGLIDINAATGSQSVISSGNLLTFPSAVTQDPLGDTFVTDHTGEIVQVNLQTGVQTLISSGGFLESPIGIVDIPEPMSATMVMAISAALMVRRPSRKFSW
jgi:hypothetical protein